MKLDNFNSTKDWAYYLSIIHASSDPLEFLLSANEIPYKKYNRTKVAQKGFFPKRIKSRENIVT